MGKAKKTKAIKEIKKRWLGIVAPEIFNRQPLGDSLVEEQTGLMGKVMLVNLMDLTKSIKQQNINLRLKVVETKDNLGLTEVIGYEMNSSSIKRMVRRDIEKLDDSFVLSTSDGKFIRIKPLVIARSAANSSVKKALRKETRNFLIREIGKMTFEAFLKEVVSNHLQTELSKRLNKIYPMRTATIRRFDVVDNIKGKKLPTAEEEAAIAKDEEIPAEETEEGTEQGEESSEEGTQETEADEDISESDEEAPAEEEPEKPKKKRAKKAEEKKEEVEDAPPSD
jgi:ribosomal protein S3AE